MEGTVAATGTPKLGYWCHTCDDWGTIVVADALAAGVTEVREIPCPDHTPPPDPPDCRCDGSGTVTVEIPLADALLLDERACPVHAAPPEHGDAP
jgi:hypothetical protein